MTPSAEQEIEIPAGVRGERADKFLASQFPEYSRTRWQQVFAEGRVWREEEALLKRDRVSSGDRIAFAFPESKEVEVGPVDIPLSVLHEDDELIAVNKAPGMVVHPGAGTGADTLVHALLYYCKGKLSTLGGTVRPGIVHRLDKETSGVIVAAKSDEAFRGLIQIFSERRTEKIYHALVAGSPKLDSGKLEGPIGRHATHRTKMTVRDDGRPARTDWQVIKRWGGVASEIACRIHSGRTHQIRVHLAHMGHPLLGDGGYGYREGNLPGTIQPPRVMLHARSLAFTHPVNGEEVRFEAPLPGDFVELRKMLTSQFGGQTEA